MISFFKPKSRLLLTCLALILALGACSDSDNESTTTATATATATGGDDGGNTGGVSEDPVCGNQSIEDGEECDNGAANSDTVADACRTDCTLPICGDGVVDADEICDRGAENYASDQDVPANSYNVCMNDCTYNESFPYCGDSEVSNEESCDNGAENSDTEADACRTTCTQAQCGDSVIDSGEECDNGQENSDTQPDACRTECSLPSCGDGVQDADEFCDSGNLNGTYNCDATCDNYAALYCGDGVVSPEHGEVCDDGANNEEYGSCASDCTAFADEYCGNNVTDGPEECDGEEYCADDCTLEAEHTFTGGNFYEVGVPITDNDLNNLTCAPLTINIPEAYPYVKTVESVALGINHESVGDLVITLQDPSNETNITLLDCAGTNTCGMAGDNSNLSVLSPIIFSELANTSAEDMGMGLGNMGVVCQDNQVCEFSPSPDSLDSLIGLNPSGQWTVCVGDAAQGDIGDFFAGIISITASITE